MFVLSAVPAWQLVKEKTPRPPEEVLRPQVVDPALVMEALADVEYRGGRARERALALLTTESTAVFARSPNDLPALLRTADQLTSLAKLRAGERAQVWTCRCGVRYAVPLVFVRPITLPCDRCGQTVELDPGSARLDQPSVDSHTAAVNAARHALSEFFHEAMARGWPVLVSRP